jgi:hypothetical protein
VSAAEMHEIADSAMGHALDAFSLLETRENMLAAALGDAIADLRTLQSELRFKAEQDAQVAS